MIPHRADSKVINFPRSGAPASGTGDRFAFEEFTLDIAVCTLRRGEDLVALTPKVFQILAFLVKHHERVVAKDELMRAVWPDTAVEESNLTQSVFVLRKALGQTQEHKFVMTFPGQGYRFVAPVRELPPPAGPEETPAPVAPPAPFPVWKLVAATAVVTVLVAGISFAVLRNGQATPVQAVFVTSLAGNEIQPAISPDGSKVAFSWNGEREDNYDIYVKTIGAEAVRRLTTHAGEDGSPCWSPDGRWIAFQRLAPNDAGIYIIAAEGGPERRVASIFPGRAGIRGRHLDWSADGKYLIFNDKAAAGGALSLFVIRPEGGEPRRLTSPPGNSSSDIGPRFSPDGQRIAFIRSSAATVRDLYIIPTAGGTPRRLTNDERWIGDVDWTRDGSTLLFTSSRAGRPTLWQVGARDAAAKAPRPFHQISGDEGAWYVNTSRRTGRVLFTKTFSDWNVWRIALQGPATGEWTRLIASTKDEVSPDYAPDGRRILFVSDRSGARQIWIADADGRNAAQLETGVPAPEVAAWSPNGNLIVFSAHPGKKHELYVVPAAGGSARRLTDGGSEAVLPRWSPDGAFIYYSSNRSGNWQIWRLPPEGGVPQQVTYDGGFAGRPSPDGKLLYYTKGQGFAGIWRTPLAGGEEKQVVAFPKPDNWGLWTVTAEGIYFLDSDVPGIPPPPILKFYRFQTGETRDIGPATRPLSVSGGYDLAISRDGRWALTAQVDQSGSDILMADPTSR
ncbi:MAG: transcriptional regulatory protein-like protein [Candidatus Solibacter sp.]|nr:transcriptional regulatory protein-like protein [Candidatus Solibacter sp.]